MQLEVAIDDLAFVTADAIARPVNARLRASTALMRRVEDAAGDKLVSQLRVSEPLDVGVAVVTGAGALEAPMMIHAVVMTDDEAVSRAGVVRATLSALERASDWRIERVAFAPFGLGAGNLDVDECAQAMLSAFVEHRNRGRACPTEVTVVVENEYEAEAFRSAKAHRWEGA